MWFRYHGNGTRIGEPLCDCKPGFWGRWCETDATRSHSYSTEYIKVEGVEPRHSVSQSVSSVQSSVSHDKENESSTSRSTTETSQGTTLNRKLGDEDFHELIHEEFGIRAIHSDIFNSGKRVESLGSREGLH